MTCEETLLSPQNTAKGAITYEDGYLADPHEKEWLSLKIRVPVMKTENQINVQWVYNPWEIVDTTVRKIT